METDQALHHVVELSLANLGASVAAVRMLLSNQKIEKEAAIMAESAQALADTPTASQALTDRAAALREIVHSNRAAIDTLMTEVERSVELVETWRAHLAKEDVRYGVILLAKADHLLWKKRLLDMACGRSPQNPDEIQDHTQCRLGQWISKQVSLTPALSAIEDPHVRVHTHGLEAAACFARGDLASGLVHYTRVEAASQDLMEKLQDAIDSAAA